MSLLATPQWWRSRAALLGGVACLAVAGGLVGIKVLGRSQQTAVQRLDPARIPLVADAAREQIRQGYLAAGGHKALAIAFDGESFAVITNRASAQDASTAAQAQCDKDSAQTENKRPCFLYAVGDTLLLDPSSFPLPPPAEILLASAGRAFGVDDPPLQRMNQGRRLLRDYPAVKAPKALAIGTRGDALWGAMATGVTVTEAARRALEFCGFRAGSGGAAGGGGGGSGNPSVGGGRTGPCILYAVGDDLVTLPPKSRRIVGVLVLATDKDIPHSERARLTAEYARGNWQALARGRGGTWHAVSGADSEQAATEQALAKCSAADKECQIHAIGRFLVAPAG